MKETFADRLKAAMEQRGLKQVDLIREAEKAGVKLGKSHMSQYVSGKTIPRSAQRGWKAGKNRRIIHLRQTYIRMINQNLQEEEPCEHLKNQANWTMYYTT